eukprot:gnl/Trimastix_PCT/1577.p1 GENE.gnl/Trimastix_PCT/1577~~gnl/Trimastix_PCT/1577.p1  ORF type:complete len:276 (+),score=28.93 gnl/Trimastix_PCT/1577:329-1156(+)
MSKAKKEASLGSDGPPLSVQQILKIWDQRRFDHLDSSFPRISSQRELTEILPFLYLGTLYAAVDIDVLLDKNIRYVVNLVILEEDVAEMKRVYGEALDDLLGIPCDDVAQYDMVQHFETCFSFIERVRLIHEEEARRMEEEEKQQADDANPTADAEKKTRRPPAVLVHCRLGQSRSATVVIAYLMRHLRMSLDAAVQDVVRKRPSVNPNHGFLRQLMAWDDSNIRRSALEAQSRSRSRAVKARSAPSSENPSPNVSPSPSPSPCPSPTPTPESNE